MTKFEINNQIFMDKKETFFSLEKKRRRG